MLKIGRQLDMLRASGCLLESALRIVPNYLCPLSANNLTTALSVTFYPVTFGYDVICNVKQRLRASEDARAAPRSIGREL